MRTAARLSVLGAAPLAPAILAQQPIADGPCKVIKSARVGGEGCSDYIYAAARRRQTRRPGPGDSGFVHDPHDRQVGRLSHPFRRLFA